MAQAELEEEEEEEVEVDEAVLFAGKTEVQKRLLKIKMAIGKGRKANKDASKRERDKARDSRYGAKERAAARDEEKAAWRADLAARGVPKEKAYLFETADSAGRGVERAKAKDKRKAAFGWDVFNNDSLQKAYEKRLDTLPAADQLTVATGTLDLDPLAYGGERIDDPDALERMAAELEQRAEQHAKFSRRRPDVPGADVDSINHRNLHFNKKLKRAFDKYTVEIRQNLERGTAV